jgi:hypothetical protein
MPWGVLPDPIDTPAHIVAPPVVFGALELLEVLLARAMKRVLLFVTSWPAE